jgi:hypothetical protein
VLRRRAHSYPSIMRYSMSQVVSRQSQIVDVRALPQNKKRKPDAFSMINFAARIGSPSLTPFRQESCRDSDC